MVGFSTQVVEAISRQLATLNTNVRYLHEGLSTYAEALTATFPEPLSVRPPPSLTPLPSRTLSYCPFAHCLECAMYDLPARQLT